MTPSFHFETNFYTGVPNCCNLFFIDIIRFGYQAQLVESQFGCMRELHNILLRGYDTYLLCLKRNFVFQLIISSGLFAMNSSEKSSSIRHSKYSTKEFCLILFSFLEIFEEG